MDSVNFFVKESIESGIIEVDEKEYKYYILHSPFGTLNGYILFPKRITAEKDYNGILTYVPVHGGITFCHEYEEGILYGFDTGHCDSNEYPIDDTKWIKEQIIVMTKGILKAAEVEKEYLASQENDVRARYAQLVQDIGEPEQRRNFGVNIKLLLGEL
ncbi:hypothetical protein [Shewanella sp.]|jgi:hypothetical protein|uniref:hypothetical protein n=1 Tax=Shewanella sp. TaxID=50422 RepID=UPI003562E361